VCVNCEFQHVWLLFLFHDNGPPTPPCAKVCVCAGRKEHVLCVCLVFVCAFAHTCARTCACATMREFANVVLQPSFVFKSVYAFLHTHTYHCCPPTSNILTQSNTHTLFSSLIQTLFLSFTLSLSVAHTHTHTHR